MMYMLYDADTGKVIGHTEVNAFSCDEGITLDDLLDSRAEAAIDDGLIPDGNYGWKPSAKKHGLLI